MKYERMPIEIESPEQMGYGNVKYNLTESSFADTKMSEISLDLNNLLLCYGDHVGNPALRELIAKECGVHKDDILLTPGAAGALFIISTALLEKGDRLLVEFPNYATNIVTPRAIGAQIDFIPLKFEADFKPNIKELESLIKPDTKFVSITLPHNPTGTMISTEELKKIIAICEKKNVWLLVDETYRDMNFGEKPPMAASLSNKVISVTSLSKTFGLPGIRTGWIICKDKALMELFLAAKEQIIICGSILDEEVAYQYYKRKNEFFPKIAAKMKENFKIVKDWIQTEKLLSWVEPVGGVVCFPKIDKQKVNVEKFYKTLNEKYETFVGPGHWFEMPREYFRLGYGWPKTDELKQGLKAISAALKDSQL